MLDIAVEPVRPGEATVRVTGELDCATASKLRAAITVLINRGDVEAIGLDLRGLDFLDSVGVGTLVVAHRICQQVGVRLRLTAASAFAAKVLGVVGVDAELGLPASRPHDEDALVAR
jgi:anti-sigma B factor antagonist